MTWEVFCLMLNYDRRRCWECGGGAEPGVCHCDFWKMDLVEAAPAVWWWAYTLTNP